MFSNLRRLAFGVAVASAALCLGAGVASAYPEAIGSSTF